MTAIYKRELSSYFNSMIGYVFVAVLIFFTGIYFMAYNLYNGLPQFSYTLYSLMSILLITIPHSDHEVHGRRSATAAPTSCCSPLPSPSPEWCWASTLPWSRCFSSPWR